MPTVFLCSTRCVVLAALVSCLACKRDADQASSEHPEHGDHDSGDHGEDHDGHHGEDHSGHHGHDHGDELNEHGYKGHRFEDPETWAGRFESPERAAWQRPDALVASLVLAPDAQIADLGAGTGYFAVRLAAAVPGGRVYAVDIEPKMVEWLASRAKDEGHDNLVAVHGEPDDPKLPEPVDLAFMCDVFHHLADPQAYFEALIPSLRPGARVVIVDFRKHAPDDAPGPPAAMRLTVDEVRAHMEAAGYTLARQDLELLEYQYLLEFVHE